jgi:hypothetical protein
MCHIKNLDERKHIRVTFIGEPAVDEGGPLREFFHLLTADIARKNMIFNGDDYRRVPRHCVMELENRTYYNVGKILALSLMHGGPAPRFLARTVVDYIVYGSAQASPLDVPDQAIQESLIKVIFRGEWLCHHLLSYVSIHVHIVSLLRIARTFKHSEILVKGQ